MMKFDIKVFVRKYRKFILIAASLLLVYTLAGFLVAPWIAQRQLVRGFRETLGLEASVQQLRVNPYMLTAEVEGFVLGHADGGELLRFDQLYLNFQLSSLFRWAWTFEEIRLVNPWIDVVLSDSGSINLGVLVPKTAGTVQKDTPETGSLPRILVHAFNLKSGRVQIEDRTHATPFLTEIGPASFTLAHFSTLPEDDGEMSFEATLESEARITWQGTIGTNPPHSEGQLTLANGHMPITKRYLQEVLPFRVLDGRTDLELNYELAFEGEDLQAAIHDSSITVRDLVVTPEDDNTEILRLPEMRIAGINFEWPQQRLAIEELSLDGIRLVVWRNTDGSINLLAPLTPQEGSLPENLETEAPPVQENAAPAMGDWQISLSQLVVDDLAITIEDRTLDPSFQTGIADVQLNVRGMDNTQGSTFDFTLTANMDTGGATSAHGEFGVLPGPNLDAAVKLDDLSLLPLQAYLDGLARLRIDSGTVSLDGRMTSNTAEQLAYRGRVSLTEFAFHDVRRDERLLGIGDMEADDLLLEMTSARLRIASINLERPYGRVTIYADGTSNVSDIFTVDTEPPGESAADLPLTIEIGEVLIGNGSADFADLSLPLPFASRIDSLQGSISEMSTAGTSARIDLDGTVDEYGLARIKGSLDFFAPERQTDVAVTFRNVEMSPLSPYSSKFAGHEVKEGRLSLDLGYHIEDRRLESENKILIEELILGEKIDSPDAPNLPVKLAVALLKDKNGRIELDIPLTGTLDDPEFAYGKLVWNAIKGVMKKVATAPFRALARLVGSEEDLEFVEFEAAGREISPPSREKLEKLAQALAERPELVLEVRGVFDPEIDAARLRDQKLESLIAERLVAQSLPDSAEPTLASDAMRFSLEALFQEQFPEESLDAVITSHTTTPSAATADGDTSVPAAEPVLDLAAYLQVLRERLTATQPVSDLELMQLANARATAIIQQLTNGAPAAIQRIHAVDGGPIKKKDAGNNWVRLRLVLSTG